MSDREVALLVRLLEKGECRDTVRNADLLQRLWQAQWIEPASRQKVWLLRRDAEPAVEHRLTALKPSWREDAHLLRNSGLDPLRPAHLGAVAGLKETPTVSGLLHRKTWNAATAAGSKIASLVSGNATLTNDWALRGRVNCQTLLHTREADIDLEELTRSLTEFCIPERGWRQARGVGGQVPRLVITVENVAALVDLALPPRTMVLYSQGTAYKGALELLRALADAQWMHFGDLDPAGLIIAKRMARLSGRPLRAYIPSFAADYLQRARPVARSWRADAWDHPVVCALIKSNRWMEQELFLLDSRLGPDLAAQANMLTKFN